jgi:RNA polymerase sigma-70 factor (ECF subfamily)
VTGHVSDEAELVARAQRGDRDAFADLMVRYGSTVLSMTWRIVGDRALAEDAAQETFLAAFRALPRFRAESRFSTWLYRIAVNKCRDLLRARASRRETSDAVEGDADDTRSGPAGRSVQHRTPEELLLDRQRAKHISEAIDQLQPIYREAFVLRHVEGLSYEEMSEVLEVDGGTLRMRVYKARQELSRELAALALK